MAGVLLGCWWSSTEGGTAFSECPSVIQSAHVFCLLMQSDRYSMLHGLKAPAWPAGEPVPIRVPTNVSNLALTSRLRQPALLQNNKGTQERAPTSFRTPNPLNDPIRYSRPVGNPTSRRTLTASGPPAKRQRLDNHTSHPGLSVSKGKNKGMLNASLLPRFFTLCDYRHFSCGS
jgi:hypothetical protein